MTAPADMVQDVPVHPKAEVGDRKVERLATLSDYLTRLESALEDDVEMTPWAHGGFLGAYAVEGGDDAFAVSASDALSDLDKAPQALVDACRAMGTTITRVAWALAPAGKVAPDTAWADLHGEDAPDDMLRAVAPVPVAVMPDVIQAVPDAPFGTTWTDPGLEDKPWNPSSNLKFRAEDKNFANPERMAQLAAQTELAAGADQIVSESVGQPIEVVRQVMSEHYKGVTGTEVIVRNGVRVRVPLSEAVDLRDERLADRGGAGGWRAYQETEEYKVYKIGPEAFAAWRAGPAFWAAFLADHADAAQARKAMVAKKDVKSKGVK